MNTAGIQFVDGLRQMYLPRLNLVQKASNVGLRKWLSETDNYIPVDTGDVNCIELSLYDATEVLECIAYDISRLSSAAFETAITINECENDRKFIAWQLVQYYYSAFYSAHSTLKICNLGLTQIDGTIISKIRMRANTLGITIPSYSKGLYCAQLFPTDPKIVLFQVGRYNDSHKGLWQRYCDFLNILSGVSVATGSFDVSCVRPLQADDSTPLCVYSHLSGSDAHLITAKIDEIKRMINKRGDNNWLSTIRNAVNYNHTFGVWYPFSTFDPTYSQLIGLNRAFLKEPLDTELAFAGDTELHDFVLCCQSINSINRSILSDLLLRHPDNKSFLRVGPLAYIMQHK